MSVEELAKDLELLKISANREAEQKKHLGILKTGYSHTMDAQAVQALVAAAITQATEKTRQSFREEIDNLTRRLARIETPVAVEAFEPVEVIPGVECSESLDLVKSLPEFNGEPNKYVSWRQAATTAHKLYESYIGSSKYYQVVAIVRNKIVGAADTVLSSYNTVLNFKAILARLDFSYGDKRSIFTLEQELSTLRQGTKSIVEFYDEVEQKLTLIVNKVLMTNEGNEDLIRALNQQYRDNALRVFISGARRPVCDILFSCKPADMPSALALAQELETNQMRYSFATTFWNQSAQAGNMRITPFNQNRTPPIARGQQPPLQNRLQTPPQREFNIQRPMQLSQPQTQHQRPEPMEIDRSLRSIQRSMQFAKQPQPIKRPLEASTRQNQNKFQRVNHVQEHEYQEDQQNDWEDNLSNYSYWEETGEGQLQEHQLKDEVNFLAETPSYRM